ncbi:hypothetical protein TREAZ_1183 [Leadbettera azotonutricia ZAS-9]|uniref:Uncharacterized protein n=1 Tax=Leadbettera azotonutricia (strain ATCC BAA-888 / DSM 13862 / ZAS-9) TaxID=545695 RepID=F5Y714_LEAAZ|nr:hypothetical protein TREAZ_1183 [Leadbettera azotonutricia ZAS-9]
MIRLVLFYDPLDEFQDISCFTGSGMMISRRRIRLLMSRVAFLLKGFMNFKTCIVFLRICLGFFKNGIIG